MISIVICSREKTILKSLHDNIDNTIGCEYELIVINNSQNRYSIFEAYNLGINESKGEYLCFIHDDILIHTQNWGEIIHEIFNENNKIGLIGVAGAKVKTKMPSGWWNCHADQKVINIIQHLRSSKEKWYYGFRNGLKNEEVVVIDGVFMAARKDERIFFNTKLKGFHNYDLNLSFEYRRNDYKIIVTNQILIEHFSIGNLNNEWLDSLYKIHSIYRKNLPSNICKEITSKNLKTLEFDNGSSFINKSLNQGNKKNIIVIWLGLIYMRPYSSFHSKFLKKIIKLVTLTK